MQIKNESVSIKIGKKEITFSNLILNAYVDLYAQSFLSFKDKMLDYCFIKFNTTQDITETSTTMDYDVILQCNYSDIDESYSENIITNKYLYYNEVVGSSDISDYAGQNITGLGFGKYNSTTEEYVLYAYLDVSLYNISYQENQDIIISRIDKIKTDLQFYSASPNVKFPVHLTMKGILENSGYDYNTVYSELYSVGFGVLYNSIREEILVSDLDFRKTGIGTITIQSAGNFAVYPSSDLYPSPDLYPRKVCNWITRIKNNRRRRWIISKYNIIS